MPNISKLPPLYLAANQNRMRSADPVAMPPLSPLPPLPIRSSRSSAPWAPVLFPPGRSAQDLDQALLYVMVNKMTDSDALLWDRINTATSLIESNGLVRKMRERMDELTRTDKENVSISREFVEFELGDNNPLRSQLIAAGTQPASGRAQRVALPVLLGIFDIKNVPGTVKELKATREKLSESLSTTESQQSQVLLQDALQKNREITATAGGMIKTRHDSKLGVLNKI